MELQREKRKATLQEECEGLVYNFITLFWLLKFSP